MSSEVHAGDTATDSHADQTNDLVQPLSRIERVIGVMSGKGGVGKSVVTALLAIAVRETGRKVGVLDADITGPSIPRMLGVHGRPEASEMGIVPVSTPDGIQVMSLNLLLESPDDPVIWRGPLLANTVQQFWKDVVWGDLDVLLVDLPPGTSDIPLTVMQSLPLAGLVVVSSPQELAAMIVRKAVKMAAMLDIRVLGLVENMTHLICPHCGKRVNLFGPEQGSNAARTTGIPVLASIPVDPDLSTLCDQGKLARYQRNPFIGHAQVLKKMLFDLSHVSESQ